jgi:hypothetical protein
MLSTLPSSRLPPHCGGTMYPRVTDGLLHSLHRKPSRRNARSTNVIVIVIVSLL